MKKFLLILLVIAGIGNHSKAQGYNDIQMSFNYNIGVPMGEFSDFINLASFRGINLQVDYYLTDRLSIGGYFGWNGFYQKKSRESFTLDRGAINGVRFNYLYQVPLYLKGQYLLSDQGKINPFVAVGVGTHYIEQETYIGTRGFSENHWKFGFAPEVGTFVMLGQSGWSFKVAAIYHFTAYNEFNMNSLQNLGINLGFNYDF